MTFCDIYLVLPRLKPVRFMGGEGVGVDLRKEFNRLGAEAQHLPLATPMEGREEGGGVKEEEEKEQEEEQ